MKTDIISSWEKNASEWIKVIQDNKIPSRKFTNKAILETIANLGCKNFADIGCGEGWLTREINKMGVQTVGFDAIEDLIEEAKKKDSGSYYVLTFEEIIKGKSIPNAPFDAAVFNFCLYLEEGLQKLLENTLKSISRNGSILIQTLHPFFLIQNGLAYKSQWLSDAWKGLPGNFEDGHSWYARTFENWSEILSTLKDVKITYQEVVNEDEKPISLIIKIKKLS
ncbi:class I SAM-dependent methyltransferase [Flagellimonas eckloniae]|uniref:Methyltransferase type 11 n=1 Tax=Flagellimonas eckloniae TaxID=346185 RepID=A0A0Q1CD53_9FLAO|nr:class I SAM-dependent methyltransferase [Allomuricauda eckloniae]KQC28600.1 methyltransferase type 11 [Allomuricauda eckloniae]